MGDELGSAADIDRLLVSSGLSTPIFAFIGNDDFWSCHTYFKPKMSPQNGNFNEFSSVSRRDRVGFPNCLDLHTLYALLCHSVSASIFQVLIGSGPRASTLGSFIRSLASPARMEKT